MARKKIKLHEEAIQWNSGCWHRLWSGSEASDFEDYFEEEDEEEGQQQQQQQQQQASAEVETQAATSGGLPTWEPP